MTGSELSPHADELTPTINTVAPGSTLANGAIVVDIAKRDRDGTTLVLCVIPYRTTRDAYATWEVTDEGTTALAHYHTTIGDALLDFERRLGQR